VSRGDRGTTDRHPGKEGQNHPKVRWPAALAAVVPAKELRANAAGSRANQQ